MPSPRKPALRGALALTGALALLATAAGPATATDRGPFRPIAPLPVSPSAAPLVEQVPDATSARLVVAVRERGQVDDVARLARSRGAAVRHSLGAIGALSVSVPRSEAAELSAALRAAPAVRSVREAVRREVAYVPDDPSYATESTYLAAVRAEPAWDLTQGDPGVRIAVVDTGVDVAHPDLVGKVVGTYNAVSGTTDVTDAVGHGTLVAGVAAAASDNGVGITGVGFDSSLLAVKVADAEGAIFTDDEAAGIIWAADHDARVINLSLGSTETDSAETAAVAYARAKGALVVASAGNDGGTPLQTVPNYPASLPGVLAVGATDPVAGTVAEFSSTGSWVTLAAPGVDVLSTSPTAGSEISPAPTGYDTVDGTSFSAPIVAGGAALLAAAFPSATGDEIAAALVAGAHGYPDLGLGAGQVDLRTSMDELTPLTRPTLTAPTEGAPVTGVVPLSATSGADSVAFLVDGERLGAPVPVVDGIATGTWASFGASQGSHQVRAADCNGRGCGTPSPTTTVELTNPAPAVLSPADGASVTGVVVVQAQTSDATPAVRLSVDGVPVGPPVTVVEQAAALSWSSVGSANGAHVLAVAACSASGACGPAGGVAVTVANAAPTLTGPLPGLVTGRTTLTAAGPAGGKLFRRGTTVLGFDATAPYAVAVDFSAVPDGSYALTVQSCGATAATCGGVVSAPVGVTARSVRPRLLAPGPAQISPNGDGRNDASTLRVALDQPMGAIWQVSNAAGVTVRGPHSLGQRPVGNTAFVWDGRGNGGARLADGLYTVTVSASRTVGGAVLRGTTRAALRVDTVAPAVAVTPVAGGLYPYPDGYRDRVSPVARITEPVTLTLVVADARGTVLRVIAAPRAAGSAWITWSGSDAHGRTLPAGVYRYAYVVADPSGNRRQSPTMSLALSAARLVGTRVTRTVTPAATVTDVLAGFCSAVAENGWPGGFDLLSAYYDEDCRDYGDDVAATLHQLVLAPAVQYSPLTLSVTGQRTYAGYDDVASAFYRDPAGELVDELVLPAAYGTRALKPAPASSLLGGRTLRWAVATTGGRWWSVRSFTVSYTAYALR